MSDTNPIAALDALATPGRVTLGQVALLEKIKSPLLVATEGTTSADVIPSLYLLALPAAEGVGHLATLERDAFAWADTLTPECYRALQQEALDAIRAFFAMLPGAEEGVPKKATSATAG